MLNFKSDKKKIVIVADPHNDINKIDKVLLDRMVVIDLKGYDVKQKTVIAEQYLLPAALKEVNLTEKVAISKEILVKIIEDYAKDEKGVRELKRSIEQVTQKINMLRMYNSPDLPFHIKDFSLPFLASFIAEIVSGFGISGSKGRAFSLAILVIMSLKAEDGVRPIAASTAVASSLIVSSILARTTAFATILAP